MTLSVSQTEPTEYFVYGTLRVGAAEWGSPGYAADPVTGCTAKGDLYNYGFAFPYADYDGEGTVQGDIITVDPLMAMHIAHVEQGAGYEAREVLVTLPDGSTKVVLSWHITDRARARLMLTPIPSGDWLVCVDNEVGRYSKRTRQRA